MKRITIIFLCALLSGAVASAQVAKQVEVTKNYVPAISPASKLAIVPDMVDTVTLRPEIDYTVTPVHFGSSLGTRRFSPATVNYWEYRREYPFYMKIGAGYPLNSTLDARASSYRADVGYVSAYINHRGQYSKIRMNDPVSGSDFKNNSQQMVNRAGVAGGKYFGRYTLSGDLSYRSDVYHRYPLLLHDFKRRKVDFEDVDFKLQFGDSFSDLSRMNFRVYGAADFYNDKSDTFISGARYQQVSASAGGSISRRIGGRGLFLVSADWRGYYGTKALADYDNTIVSGKIMYGYRSRRGLNFKIGASYHYDRNSMDAEKKNRHYVIPYLHIALDLHEKGVFVPYLEVDGSIENNSYYSLVKRNPYVDVLGAASRLTSLPNTACYNVRFGVSGHSSNSKFAYRFYANMSFLENALYWYNVNRIYFDAETGRKNIWSLNAAIDYKPISQLYMSLRVKGMVYTNFKAPALAIAAPPVEASLKVRYTQKKFALGASADVVGVRKWTGVVYPEFGVAEVERATWRLPAYVDVGVAADWYVSPKCTVFAEGKNLANMKIYRWAYYREYGANFTVGVKLQF